MTIPTVGRVMLFHPAVDQQRQSFTMPTIGEPLAAIVAAVLFKGACVNLSVFDANGVQHPKQGVPVVQDGQEPPPSGYYCCWMPYQVSKHRSEDEAKKIIDAFEQAPRGKLECAPDDSAEAARDLRRTMLAYAIDICKYSHCDVFATAKQMVQFVNGEGA